LYQYSRVQWQSPAVTNDRLLNLLSPEYDRDHFQSLINPSPDINQPIPQILRKFTHRKSSMVTPPSLYQM